VPNVRCDDHSLTVAASAVHFGSTRVVFSRGRKFCGMCSKSDMTWRCARSVVLTVQISCSVLARLTDWFSVWGPNWTTQLSPHAKQSMTLGCVEIIIGVVTPSSPRAQFSENWDVALFYWLSVACRSPILRELRVSTLLLQRSKNRHLKFQV